MTSRSIKYFERKKWEKENKETMYHWMCSCGHYEESGFHCAECGNEPPWGCDCSFCNDFDEDEEDFDYVID